MSSVHRCYRCKTLSAEKAYLRKASTVWVKLWPNKKGEGMIALSSEEEGRYKHPPSSFPETCLICRKELAVLVTEAYREWWSGRVN